VVGDLLWRFYSTGLGDEGIIAQGSYHRFRRRKREVVLGEEASPEDIDVMAFRPAAGRAYEGSQEGGIIQAVKEPSEVFDDGWRLNFCAEGGSISECHGKLTPSCWLRDAVVDRTCVSAFVGASLLPYIATVKPFPNNKLTIKRRALDLSRQIIRAFVPKEERAGFPAPSISVVSTGTIG